MNYRNLFNFLVSILLLTSSSAQAIVVGIMAVDEEELGNVISFLEGPIEKYTYGMRIFYRGQLWGAEAVIVLSNAGKAAAAAATIDLINERVDHIVFLGTAGALDKRLNIGDVVIAENLMEFDVDFRPFTALYEFPDRQKLYPTDDNLRETAKEVVSEFLKTEMHSQIDEQTRQEMLIETPKVITAAVGTADHFLISKDEIHNLANFAPEVVCVDMESAAVAQVAKNYGLPLTIIRTISNYIDTPSDLHFRAAIDYKIFLQKVQAVYAKNILERLFPKIQLIQKKPKDLNDHDKVVAGIICASEIELQSLSQFFKTPLKRVNGGGRDFYQGRIGQHEVVLTASGFGKSAVSAMAEDLILNEKVKLLIVVGNAFSVDENVSVDDIVISQFLIEYDVDVRPFRPLFQLPTIGITELPAHTKAIQIAYNVSRKHGVHIGQVASGDKILSQEDLLLLKKRLPKILCIDTEAAPAAQIAYQANIPFISIKKISQNGLLTVPLDTSLLQTLQKLFDKLEETDLDL